MMMVQVRKGTEDNEGSSKKGLNDEGSDKKALKMMMVQVRKGTEDNEGSSKKGLKMTRVQARRD